MNHRRGLWATIGSVLMIVALIGFWIFYEYSRYERAYARLTRGTSKREVIKQFGKPASIEGCRATPLWDEEPVVKVSAKCVEEFRYFSRLRIGAWIVGFDADGRAITKYYESSRRRTDPMELSHARPFNQQLELWNGTKMPIGKQSWQPVGWTAPLK